MKMLSMKMMICMGVGVMGYLYVRKHPEIFDHMRNINQNMKCMMDDMINGSEKCVKEME